MSKESWLDICTNYNDTTKTVEDEYGNITHLKTVKHGDDITILKGINISGNTSKKTAVDTMRKKDLNNVEIANTKKKDVTTIKVKRIK